MTIISGPNIQLNLDNKKDYDFYLKDITAAARDTPEMELKLGRWDSTKWTEAKIIMKKVNLIFLQLSHTVSWNFCKDFPPVTI